MKRMIELGVEGFTPQQNGNVTFLRHDGAMEEGKPEPVLIVETVDTIFWARTEPKPCSTDWE